MKGQYIIIDEKKTPKHSLDSPKTYEEVKNEDNLALLVEEPYVVLDIDSEDHFNCLCEIVKDYGIRTRIMKTNRGGHFWFKSILPLTNNIDINTPITLKTDVKSWGKKSMVTVKLHGVWRQWIKSDDIVDELPYWLKPIKWKKDLYGLKDGDGRDAGLFSCIIPLMQQGYNKQQIQYIFNIINSYVFAEQLKSREIAKMFDNNKIFEEKQIGFYEGKTFQHNIFADWMLETYDYRKFGGVLYSYENGKYWEDDEKNSKIKLAMITKLPTLKDKDQREVYQNLRLKVLDGFPNEFPLMINFKNGMYNLQTDKFEPHNAAIFSLNQMNCQYNPDAHSADVDLLLNNVSCKNASIRNLLEEMLGYILIGDCRFQKSFILLGEGANGKSVFLDMIINWLGPENCSSLALEDLSDRFRPSQLVGKMVNIGDDSGADLLKNTAIFKKLVTGDPITLEFKHGQPFSYANRAKMIFSANNLPPSSDKSNGFMRRMAIVPFNAKFLPTDDDYDPLIGKKVCTEEAKSYILNLAIKAAKRLIQNKQFTIPEEVKQEVDKYEIANNNVLSFVMEVPPIVDKDVTKTYANYCLYCVKNNTTPYKINKFIEEILRHEIDLTIDIEVTDTGKIRTWRKKEQED